MVWNKPDSEAVDALSRQLGVEPEQADDRGRERRIKHGGEHCRCVRLRSNRFRCSKLTQAGAAVTESLMGRARDASILKATDVQGDKRIYRREAKRMYTKPR